MNRCSSGYYRSCEGNEDIMMQMLSVVFEYYYDEGEQKLLLIASCAEDIEPFSSVSEVCSSYFCCDLIG